MGVSVCRWIKSTFFIFIGRKRVNIPSYIVKEGQEMEIRVKDNFRQAIKDSLEQSTKERSVPTWMKTDNANFKINIVRLPEKEDLIISIDEQLIVELYSK